MKTLCRKTYSRSLYNTRCAPKQIGTRMSKMLFNATHAEEVRVAIVENNQLTDLLLEQTRREQKKSNIYKGRVTRVEPSLEAAFIDFGQQRHGFLPLKEIAPEYHQKANPNSDKRTSIKELVREGQELLVQVEKEERGNKGAALSTMISLAGSYLVLMPNSPKAGGISRRIEGEERTQLKELLAELTIPKGMGVIIRTAGIGRSRDELQWDLDYLISLWQAITTAEADLSAPTLVHQEGNVSIRALRDYFRNDIDEIHVDDANLFEQVKQLTSWLHPDFANNVKHYSSKTPLFTKYQIENQIEAIYQREIRLPSGASIVIDRSEALIAIDINSAQATKGGDIEETALSINLEAADEIARQLRLRDLGGLVVIDFIDMLPIRHQRDVEERLTQAFTRDRARIQVGRISRFGLLELSRQRLRSSVAETTQEVCPRCHGRGTIRGVESLAISILRLIEDAASKEGTSQVHAQVPVHVATYLLNEKRDTLNQLERLHSAHILIIPNHHMKTPEFELNRIKGAPRTFGSTNSYDMIEDAKKSDMPDFATPDTQEKDVPAVKHVAPSKPAPVGRTAEKKGSLLSRIFQHVFGEDEAPKAKKTSHQRQSSGQRRNNNNQNRNNQNRQSASGNRNNNNNRRNNQNNNQGNRRNNNQRRRNTEKTSTVQRETKHFPIGKDDKVATKQDPASTSAVEKPETAEKATTAQNNKSGGQRKNNNNRRRNDRNPYRNNRDKKPNVKKDDVKVEATTPVEKPIVKEEKKPVAKPAAAKKPTTPPAKKPAASRPKPKPTENTDGFVQVESKGGAKTESKQRSETQEVAAKKREPKKADQGEMAMVETKKADE